MRDYILLMHADATKPPASTLWQTYFAKLRERDAFQGGSSIGSGEVLRKEGALPTLTNHLTGYMRVRAENLAAARALVDGNPVYESGGSVEIRELPLD